MFSKSNIGWSPLGSKIVPLNYDDTPGFGVAFAFNPAGDLLFVGGNLHHAKLGTVWIYSKNSTNAWNEYRSIELPNVLAQQEYEDDYYFGSSISISLDGSTLAIGAPRANNGVGAAWIFSLDGNNVGNLPFKVVGNDSIGQSLQGVYLSLDANGSRIVISGQNDSNGIGAAWVFQQDVMRARTESPTAVLKTRRPTQNSRSQKLKDIQLTSSGVRTSFAISYYFIVFLLISYPLFCFV